MSLIPFLIHIVLEETFTWPHWHMLCIYVTTIDSHVSANQRTKLQELLIFIHSRDPCILEPYTPPSSHRKQLSLLYNTLYFASTFFIGHPPPPNTFCQADSHREEGKNSAKDMFSDKNSLMMQCLYRNAVWSTTFKEMANDVYFLKYVK